MNRTAAPAYLFTETGLDAMKRFIDGTTLFAFDLDGTLAPVVADPASVIISGPVKKGLAQLAGQAHVAVITGRARADALKYLPFAPPGLIGNHGAEGLPGWELRTREFTAMARDWHRQLEGLLDMDNPTGVVIENKGPTLSLHYRHAADAHKAKRIIAEAAGRLTPVPRQVSGKYVLNLIPQGAPDKGTALAVLMREAGCVKGLFAGDDETDEDVFRLDKNIFSVLVGMRKNSRACYYLRSQQEMIRLLEEINEAVSAKKCPGNSAQI